jgi:tRNA A-37 threonylcarbamoyl transferase component Bud32
VDGTAVISDGRAKIWVDRGALADFDPRLFDPAWLAQTGRLAGGSEGRARAHFLNHGGHDLVLRHYRRGGAVSPLLGDRFLRGPAAGSRAMREFALLGWMRGQGLAVPRPVAARWQPQGLWYRADLLTERIPDAATLAARLQAGQAADWARIGAAIAALHAAGVWHADLNCRNILLDGGGSVWLIDFDRCARRRGGWWQAANLDRLHRSLAKEAAGPAGLAWSPADWQALLVGYRAALSPQPAPV